LGYLNAHYLSSEAYNLRRSQSGNHPQNNLAKFGYILDKKVGGKMPKKMLVYSWLPNYHKFYEDLDLC
jgi:hypothetical protein